MCGLAGVVSWSDRYRTSREVLARMSGRIAHRGPDGEGLWMNHEGEVSAGRPQAALAHRRLAIIDLDERANQPFTDGRGRWLVFNGEIYNYRELRKELEGVLPGYAWRTQSDTEVLLAAYAAWGGQCVERLNGMFAFAVWDESQQSVYCAVDRMGQKPLYWAALTTTGAIWTGIPDPDVSAGEPARWRLESGDRLAALGFASELPALLELPWIDRSLNYRGLGHYLYWGCICGSQTIYNGARKMSPSTWGRVTPAGVSTGRYFDCNADTDPPADADAPVQVRDRVIRAVRRQLIADVPLGCFLSGGVDSSIVAAAMRDGVESAREVLTFSIGFDDPRYDETGYAAGVARHLGTRHEQFVVRPDAADDLPKLAAVWGEPFGDSSALPTHYLARETRARVKVALSGDGGDELFGGYDRYRAMKMVAAMEHLPDAIRKAAASEVWQRLPGSHPKSFMVRLKRFLASADFPDAARRYFHMMSIFNVTRAGELIPDWQKLGMVDDTPLLEFTRLLRGRDAVQAAAALDRVWYLPFDLLTKVDRCSMLHALEVRSPFMDHEVVEFAAGLTTPQLLKGGAKRMLREAFAADLPGWVFKRKKMGFAVPIGEWFRGALRAMLRDHLFAGDSFAAGHFNQEVVRRLVEEHEAERGDHSQRLYALLMLELWWRGRK